jgi:predicted O-methyltransferase YrrM
MYWPKRILYLIKNNLLFREIASHLKHSRHSNPEKILPVVSIRDLTDDSRPKMAEQEIKDGNVTLLELECISKLVKYFKPDSIFEIGTFDGRTTLNMALNAAGTKIYTLDLPKSEMSNTGLRIKSGDKKFISKEISGSRFIGTEHETNITQIYADSAKFDYTPYENKMDFVFIDGSHSYEYVLSDTRHAMKLLRNGKGVILWHDYGWREVVQALNEYYENDPLFKNLKNIENTSLAILQL